MRKMNGVSAVVALLAVTVLACGSNKPEPSAPSAPGSDTAAANDAGPAVVATSEPESTSGSSGSGAADGDAGAPAAPAKPPVTIGETKDECTPVGVDFEKRARPKLKDCYAQGKKKNPNLEGTVKIKVTVDVKGKIKSTKILEKTLPDPVAECMLKVIKTTPFPEVGKCWDASLTIPITFPTPH